VRLLNSICQSRGGWFVPITVRRLCLLAATTCAIAVFLPSAALAAHCAPPGNSSVGQYYETIPGSGCNRGPGGPSGHHGGGSLPRGAAGQLSAQGGVGRAVAAFVRSTGTAPGQGGGTGHTTGGRAGKSGPGGSGSHRSSSGRTDKGGSVTAPRVHGSSLAAALLHPIVGGSDSGTGLGLLLPLFLGLAALALVAVVLLRRRRLRLEAKS